MLDLFHFPMHENFAAQLLYDTGNFFPHLARPILRIKELLDQRSLNILLRDVGLLLGHHFLKNVSDGLKNRQSLNALSAPLSADFFAFNPPNLFGVGFEEGKVQFTAKAVDKELLQIRFRLDGKNKRA